VLVVQALFFADGGLLASRLQHLQSGIRSGFRRVPLIYRIIAGLAPQLRPTGQLRLSVASHRRRDRRAATGGFRRRRRDGSSGISSLPFSTFVLFMQPIHLAIGIVEGVVTAGDCLVRPSCPAGLAGWRRVNRNWQRRCAGCCWLFSPGPC
jgi:cobalt/nickel transport system permease protein